MPITIEERRARDRSYAAQTRAKREALGLTSKGTSRTRRRRSDAWDEILVHAAEIADSYDTPVTLRQLFYRLVSDGTLKNTTSEYGQLSWRTAAARREDAFPTLSDRTSEVHLRLGWQSPEEMLDAARRQYRRNRTEGQEQQIWIVVEKAGLLEQFARWFGTPFGIPVAALSGYASQTDADTIIGHVENDGREAVLLYGGDFDPSGEDIYRDLVERTDCWTEATRVALTDDQVGGFGLSELPGKTADPRASRFIKEHGRLVQVEIDALDPDDLHDLFREAVDALWNRSAYESVMEREAAERESMKVNR